MSSPVRREQNEVFDMESLQKELVEKVEVLKGKENEVRVADQNLIEKVRDIHKETPMYAAATYCYQPQRFDFNCIKLTDFTFLSSKPIHHQQENQIFDDQQYKKFQINEILKKQDNFFEENRIQFQWMADKKNLETLSLITNSIAWNGFGRKNFIEESSINIDSMAALGKLLHSNIKVHLSFWGWRYITFKDKENDISESIDTLPERVLKFVLKFPHFNEKTRKEGQTITQSIHEIYKISDEQVENAQIITKIFVAIREFFNFIFSGFKHWHSKTRWNWQACEIETKQTNYPDKSGYHRVFRYYTEEQYKNAFGEPVQPATLNLHCLNNLYLKLPKNMFA